MEVICLNKGWEFIFGDEGTFEAPVTVDLPHDYIIGRPRSADSAGTSSNGYFGAGKGDYRRTFTLTKEQMNKKVQLYVDGAYMNAEYIVNGSLLAHHAHGYAPYLLDISSAVQEGENTLRILTQSRQPSTRWYCGGGLYRCVELWLGDLTPWAVQVIPTIKDGKGFIEVRFDGDVTAKLFDKEGKQVAEGGKTLEIASPDLWDVDTPYLYSLTLNSGEETLTLPVGFRTMEYVPQVGMKLNGKVIKLHGGCIHHDNGILGACAFPDAERRKIRKLKALGYNAIRSAHNPPSRALLDACDEEGMLVMTEAFDVWNENKKALDYHLYFRDHWKEDVQAMVLAARNHASVFSYSIGNEIAERDGRSEGHIWAAKLRQAVLEMDATRPITSALNNITSGGARSFKDWVFSTNEDNPVQKPQYDPDLFAEKTEGFCKSLDLVGYNYLVDRYAYDKVKYPERLIIGTETFSINTYEYWKETVENANVIGDFIWTAVDYLGEAGIGRVFYEDNPDEVWSFAGKYPWIHSFDADVDLIGSTRPQGAYRDILWNNKTEPALFTTAPENTGKKGGGMGWHFFDVRPAWDYDKAGAPVEVMCFTQAKEVTFVLNGKVVAAVPTEKCIARAVLPYEAGTLKAIADGKECVLVTPEKPVFADLCKEEYNDLTFIHVTLKDEKGNPVRSADKQLSVTVTGGKLIAAGNADPKPDRVLPFALDDIRTWEGEALLIVTAGAEVSVTF